MCAKSIGKTVRRTFTVAGSGVSLPFQAVSTGSRRFRPRPPFGLVGPAAVSAAEPAAASNRNRTTPVVWRAPAPSSSRTTALRPLALIAKEGPLSAGPIAVLPIIDKEGRRLPKTKPATPAGRPSSSGNRRPEFNHAAVRRKETGEQQHQQKLVLAVPSASNNNNNPGGSVPAAEREQELLRWPPSSRTRENPGTVR